MKPERRNNIEMFLNVLLTKMELGEAEHGPSKGNELEELENELIDLVGWSFVRWERLRDSYSVCAGGCGDTKTGTGYWMCDRCFQKKVWKACLEFQIANKKKK